MGSINGLPVHVLVVHVVVVLVPLTAAVVVIAALWPAARTRLGVVGPALALVTLASVPLATSAGEWLQERVVETELVRNHTSIGDTLTPWAIGLAVLAVAVWWLDGASGRRSARGFRSVALEDTRTRAVLGVLAVVVALGALVSVYRIGDSGARAAWDGRLTSTAEASGEG